MTIKAENSLVDKPQSDSKLNASIQLENDGVTYCIFDSVNRKYTTLKSYRIDKKPYSKAYFEKLIEIFKENSIEQNKFSSITFILVNDKANLVPLSIYKKENKKDYVELCHTIKEDDSILDNTLNTIEAKNLFTIPALLGKYLLKNFPKAKLFHHSSILIEGLLAKYKNRESNESVFVNIQRSYIDILVIKGKTLRFHNSFFYKTPEDFIYFILYVLEQLNLNPEETNITFCGNINKASSFTEISNKYIRNISFIDRNDSFKYSYVFDTLPKNYFFNLFNAQM